MTLEILPPSPNWYLTSASSVSEDGILAFATKSSVYLLDITVSPPTLRGSLYGHSERVTAVSCCRISGGTHLCATAADDAAVKIWDLKSKTVLFEKRCLENKITSLDWSTASKDIVVAGDEKGYLMYWNLETGDVKLLKPDKGSIYSLACSPHDARIIAVGYKEGKILIVNALNKRDQVVHNLRGHNDEVQSVAWAPYLGEEDFQKKKKPGDEEEDACEPTEAGCLLISGSRDKTLRVWSTGQGKLLKVLNLPPRGGGGQRPRDRGDEQGMKSRVWVSLYWSKKRPHQLVSSSHGGDVILWDLSRSGQLRWEILGQEGDSTHLRSVFNIVGRSSDADRVITTSMDRQVICWNLTTMKAEWSLPTLGGFVYCIASSPLDPTRLAVGVGDNMIRVWNTGACGKTYDVITLWQGIKSKVTVVCWHPTRENSLAYGTDDGRVGIFNASSQGKPPQQSWTYHKKTVYSLSWGPSCPKPEGQSNQTYCLYSCGGEGTIYQHNPAKLDQEAANVNSLIKRTNNFQHLLPQRSDIAWRTDGKAVAIGNEDGSIEVFVPPDLRMVCTIHVQSKIINCLQWYPEWTDQSDDSKFKTVQSDDDGGLQNDPPDSGELKTDQSGRVNFKTDQPDCSDISGEGLNGQSEVQSQAETEKQPSEDGSTSDANSQSFQSQEITKVEETKKADVSEKNVNGRQSEKRYWLASGSNDYEVEIYDLGNILSNTSSETSSVPITSSFRRLTGHSARVTSLAWSPHGDGRLVSTSYDNSAQVWDAVKGEPIANFRGHSGRVFACHVSCSDPDVVLTGAEDFCLMKWRVSETKDVRPPKTSRRQFTGSKKPGRKGKRTSQQRPPQERVSDGVTMATRKTEKIEVTGDASKEEINTTEALTKDQVTVAQSGNDGAKAAPSSKVHGDEKREEEEEEEKRKLEKMKRELLAQVEEIEGRMKQEQNETETDPDETKVEEDSSDPKTNVALDSVLGRLGYGMGGATEGPGAASDPLSYGKGGTSDGPMRGVVRDMTQPFTRKGRPKRYKSLFPLSGGQDNRGKAFQQQDCIELARIKQGQISGQSSPPLNLDPTSSHLGLFASRKMTLQMMNEEANQHAESGNFDQHCQLNLWKGNILHPLREATRKGQLTDWLVAMAPLAGHDVWLKTCEAFAKQLEAQEHFHRAVTYYLLSQQVYKAIAMLKKHNMLRDAIALAQVRLLPSDPVLHDLFVTWAGLHDGNNSYEPAARCYLAANQTLNAVTVLARKGDTAALATALHVAIVTGLTEDGLVLSIATRFLNSSLATGEWKQAYKLFSLHKKYETFARLVLVYELLVWCLVHQGCLAPSHDIDYTDVHREMICKVQWKENNDGSWPTPTINGAALLVALFETAGISGDKSHDQLLSPDFMAPTTDDQSCDINKILKLAAQHLLLVQYYSSGSGDQEVLFGHLIEGLKACHLTSHPTVAMAMLQLALLQGEEMLQEGESGRTQQDVVSLPACLRAYCKLTQLHYIRESLVSRSLPSRPSNAVKGQRSIELEESCSTSKGHGSKESKEGCQDSGTSPDGQRGGAESLEAEVTGRPAGNGGSGADGGQEEVGDDPSLTFNPRTEGHLFHDEMLKGTSRAWPVSLSTDLLERSMSAALHVVGEKTENGSGKASATILQEEDRNGDVQPNSTVSPAGDRRENESGKLSAALPTNSDGPNVSLEDLIALILSMDDSTNLCKGKETDPAETNAVRPSGVPSLSGGEGGKNLSESSERIEANGDVNVVKEKGITTETGHDINQIAKLSGQTLEQESLNGQSSVIGNERSIANLKGPSRQTSAEAYLKQLVTIREALLSDRHALPCIVCAKLKPLIQHQEKRDAQNELDKSLPDVGRVGNGDGLLGKWDPKDARWKRIFDGIARLTSEDLRRLLSRDHVREFLCMLCNRLQVLVNRFPDPRSSLAALLDAMLVLRAQSQDGHLTADPQSQDDGHMTAADPQSHDGHMTADSLLRELCDWGNVYLAR